MAATTDAAVLLEHLADGVLAVDRDGLIVWASARLATMLGARDLVGRRVVDVFPGATLRGEERRTAVTVGGDEISVLLSSDGVAGGDRTVVVKDLRAWVGESAGRPRARDLERALGRVFRGALRTTGGEFDGEEDADRLAATLAEQGRRLIPRTDCLIALVDPGRPGVFRVGGAAGPWASEIAGQEFELEGSLVEQTVAGRRTLETSSAQRDSPLRGVLAGGDIRTIRLIPVVADQPLPDGRTALGTIGFYGRRDAPFTAHQRRLTDEFATLVSLALMRAALRRAARLGEERLQTALEFALDLSRSLDVREVAGRLLERTLSAVGAQRVVILRVDGPDTVTEDYRDVDGHPDVIGYRHPIQLQPLMERALTGGAPVIGQRYLSGVFPELLRGALEGVRHTLTVPLMLGSEPVAVLVLSRRIDRAFGADEVATIRLLGGLAALALRNAALYEQAREANRVKSDFLNMAAHELRTPFTVVAGYVSMLQDGSFGETPPPLRQPVDTLSAKSAELGRLVEDLLLTARLETGGLPVQALRFDAALAVAQAVERAEPRSALVGADIAADVPDEPVHAFGDPAHVARVLDNLLNNALSYSRGTPVVRLRVRGAGESVRFEVEDRGRGITPAQAERVFERFYRGESEAYPNQPGSGLGLYICRQLAERQGGRLTLEWSRVGEGSRFVLALPSAGGA